MMKLLDYYYLVLLRVIVGKLIYQAPAIMAITFTMNLLALTFLIAHQYIDGNYLFLGCLIIGFVLHIVLQMIYSIKRTKRIKERYENESLESRRRGAAWVIIYEILSIVFVIIVISMTVTPK